MGFCFDIHHKGSSILVDLESEKKINNDWQASYSLIHFMHDSSSMLTLKGKAPVRVADYARF